jgi:hypothetical protein
VDLEVAGSSPVFHPPEASRLPARFLFFTTTIDHIAAFEVK